MNQLKEAVVLLMVAIGGLAVVAVYGLLILGGIYPWLERHGIVNQPNRF